MEHDRRTDTNEANDRRGDEEGDHAEVEVLADDPARAMTEPAREARRNANTQRQSRLGCSAFGTSHGPVGILGLVEPAGREVERMADRIRTDHPTASRKRFRFAGAVALLTVAIGTGCSSTEEKSAPTSSSPQTQRASAVVYRTPTCGCCKSYEEYLRKHGFTIQSEVLDDLEPVRSQNGVPEESASCHTVLIDGYAIEGHVPVEAIDELLAKRPAVDGIGIPGMPTNAPGMGEPDGRSIEVLSFDDGNVDSFTTLSDWR